MRALFGAYYCLLNERRTNCRSLHFCNESRTSSQYCIVFKEIHIQISRLGRYTNEIPAQTIMLPTRKFMVFGDVLVMTACTLFPSSHYTHILTGSRTYLYSSVDIMIHQLDTVQFTCAAIATLIVPPLDSTDTETQICSSRTILQKWQISTKQWLFQPYMSYVQRFTFDSTWLQQKYIDIPKGGNLFLSFQNIFLCWLFKFLDTIL